MLLRKREREKERERESSQGFVSFCISLFFLLFIVRVFVIICISFEVIC